MTGNYSFLLLLATIFATGFCRTPLLCLNTCPEECIKLSKKGGCPECLCPPPPPPLPPPKEPARDACFGQCMDAGCVVKNGEAVCIGVQGPNHPLIPPKPLPPPLPPFKNREPYRDACFGKCMDCGCTVKYGEAVCDCKPGPNHPLIDPPIVPEHEYECMPPQCEDPCYLYVVKAKTCPICKCPRVKTGTIRPRPPIIECMPPLCESPCYLFRDKSMVCPGCKCPSTEPTTVRPRRQIQCTPSLCEKPCYLYKNNSISCTGCKCPTTKRVTLRPVIQCMPPICESPCYLFRDKSMVCPGCKCPPDAPLTRSPPVIECIPLCEFPCYLANDKTKTCPICKCP